MRIALKVCIITGTFGFGNAAPPLPSGNAARKGIQPRSLPHGPGSQLGQPNQPSQPWINNDVSSYPRVGVQENHRQPPENIGKWSFLMIIDWFKCQRGSIWSCFMFSVQIFFELASFTPKIAYFVIIFVLKIQCFRAYLPSKSLKIPARSLSSQNLVFCTYFPCLS